ncbi:MAG: hypothetical protein GY850_07995, partial [bacterium]|nr:hypothetical protein [bacterium]
MIIPPGLGIITTCSMYLNEHYVVLQSGHPTELETGSHFPATILDPIKTRGIRIFLEIGNSSKHPIVNPLIPAKVYRAPKARTLKPPVKAERRAKPIGYKNMRALAKRFNSMKSSKCHYLARPSAIIKNNGSDVNKARLYLNGPGQACKVTKLVCEFARKDYSTKSVCPHVYATSTIELQSTEKPATLAIKYFPNSMEH